MDLLLFNTLTRRKEKFESIEAGKVRMYCCGPTVYDFLHVGNFRGAVFYNFVRNWLESSGYEVSYAYNFTDVDDKILKRAREEKVESKVIAERFIEEFWKDFKALKLTAHDHNPRVTEHMSAITGLIGRLIEKGKAYEVDGEVFYSISSFEDYGKLSGRKPEDMQSGVRIEVDPKKKSPLDFTLWKPAKEGEESWPSPWGAGRPGWHIECSAMNEALYGEQIDIHGGGMDLIFPHHENEIAQSEGVSGKNYARYWMHNNMFTFSGTKMSKSLGNIRTMRSFLEKYNGEIFKYLVMVVHYRSESDFSDTTISNSVSGLARIYSALAKAETYREGVQEVKHPDVEKMHKAIESARTEVHNSFNDDFNSPKAMASLFDVVRLFNQMVPHGVKKSAQATSVAHQVFEFVREFGQPMALFQEAPKEYLQLLDEMLLEEKGLEKSEIDRLVAARGEARASKDYKESDRLRDQLVEMGIDLRDSAQGTIWEVKKGS